MTTSIFGDIKLATDVEQAVLSTIELWFKTYARELELQQGLPQDALPLPRGYLTVDRFDRTNTPLPTVVAISPGFAHPPRQEGDGTFRAWFNVGVGVFVSGKDAHSNKMLVRTYTAIIRAIMLQRQSLGGFADGTTYVDESYDDAFAAVDEGTIGAGQVVFEIEVANIVSRYGGPAQPVPPDPDTQPGSQWGLVDTVSATVGIKED